MKRRIEREEDAKMWTGEEMESEDLKDGREMMLQNRYWRKGEGKGGDMGLQR